ncbi:MAG: M48 family metallopeptidase [Actinomycetota bacterium]|nr:M48 family metallopeptidase [Actinomycetota bacterium]
MKESFGRRVAVAAALLVGFYVFAGLVAAGMFGVVIAMFATDLPQNVWVAAACVFSGLAIVRGLIPSRRRFEEPGPRLARDQQPDLHAVVQEVADATGQEPPADVYLTPEVNAAVLDTGGLFGAGGRRVMIIGLPLLDVLTVGQLRAVLAHEFGHYYGGDTRLGPWFFRAYDAIARTVTNLEQRESIWQKPFEWYGMFFLRRSAAIKREQEFKADELAAGAAGRSAAIECLNAVHSAGPAFDGYWESEVAPVLGSGARAPLLGGFRAFRSSENVKRVIEDGLRADLEQPETDPYDTHPSLRERVGALERLPDDGREPNPGDERPAIALLRDPDRAEQDLLVALFGADGATLEPVAWDDVPAKVIVPGWRESFAHFGGALAGITVGGIAEVATQLERLGRELPLPPGIPPDAGPFPSELYEDVAASALDVGLGLALHDAGWSITAAPGDPIELHHGEHHVKPIGTARAVADGELRPDDWRATCERAGIASLPLGGQAAAKPPGPSAAPAASGT